MKNCKLTNHFLSTILGGGCIVLSLLLVSCNNFLDAGKVKDDIQDAIAYNNAKEINIQIDSEGMGLTTPNGSVSKKIGYDFEIQFKPDTDNYILIDKTSIFEAVNYYDRSQSLDEYVTYYPAYQTEEDKNYGIYRQKVKINKTVTGLCFIPKCRQLPVITQTIPGYTANGVYANQNIKVSFSMPMEAADTDRKDSLFNFTNIKLTYKNQKVHDWFYEPSFNADKTLLTIAPKAKVIRDYIIENSLTVVEIEVSFGDRLYVKNGDEIIPFKQNEKSTFTICYNENIEEKAPEKKDFFVTREQIDLSKALDLSADKKFVQKLVKEQLNEDNPDNSKYLSTKEILQNRARDYVYLYGRYYDAESGVKEIEINERCTNKPGKNSVYETSITHYFDERSEDFELSDEGNGYTSFVVKCPLESIDGAVLFELIVKDACGNESSNESLAVIKKTTVNCPGVYIENIPYGVFAAGDFTYDYYLQNYKTIKIYGGSSSGKNHTICDRAYGSWYSVNNYTVRGIYKDKTGTLRSEKFSKGDVNLYYKEDSITDVWTLPLDVDTVNNLAVKIIIEDDIGNTFEKDFVFPPGEKISYINPSQITFSALDSSYITISKKNGVYVLRDFSSVIEDSEERYPVPVEGLMFASLYILLGEMQGPFTKLAISQDEFTSNQDSLPDLEVINKSWVDIGEPKKIGLKIEFSDNWSQYDFLIISNRFFESKKEIIIEYDSMDAFKSFYLNLDYGLKGIYKKSINKKYLVTKLDYASNPSLVEYDYTSAKVSSGAMDNLKEVFTFSLSDTGVGPKNALITLNNGKVYEISSDNNYKCTISKGDLDIVAGAKPKVAAYIACDNANREFAGEISIEIGTRPFFQRLVKNNQGKYSLYTRPSETAINGSENLRYSMFADGNWTEPVTTSSSIGISTDSEDYGYVSHTGELPWDFSEPAFYKIEYAIYMSAPLYYFAGRKSTGKYDYIFKEDKDSIQVMSDSVVYAHTLYVNRPYEVCRNWTWEEWEIYGNDCGKKLMTFAENAIMPQTYDIPAELPNEAFYVVIFHFAKEDGTKAVMSKVYTK